MAGLGFATRRGVKKCWGELRGNVPRLRLAPGPPITVAYPLVLAMPVSVQVYNFLLLRDDYNKCLSCFLRLCSRHGEYLEKATSMEKQNKSIQREKRRLASMGFMRRISDVHSPCQWKHNCHGGRCPALVRAGGNMYCSHNMI